MAIDSGTADKNIQFGNNDLTFGLPITMGGWFWGDSATTQNNRYFINVRDDDGTHYCALTMNFDSTYEINATKTGTGGTITATSDTGPNSRDQWKHACAVFEGSAGTGGTVNLYVDGAKWTNAYSTSGHNQSNYTIRLYDAPGGAGRHYRGKGAEWFVYDAQLTDAECYALNKGVSPLLIRPESLRFYYHGFRNTSSEPNMIDLTTPYAYIVNGGMTKVDHPPNIIYPAPIQYGISAGAAPAAEKLLKYFFSTGRQVLTPRSRL